MVHYWNWNKISLKSLRVKIEIIGPDTCFPLFRGLHEVLQKWALLQRDHVIWSCDWSGWIKTLNIEATRRVKEQKIRTHWINSSTHCTVPLQQLSLTFHTAYCINPAKLPKRQKKRGVMPFYVSLILHTTHAPYCSAAGCSTMQGRTPAALLQDWNF